MSRFKNAIFNCREATYLIEKKSAEGITSKENRHLLIHLFLCKICRLYNKQSAAIQQIVLAMMNEVNDRPASKLTDEVKQQFQDEINSRIKS